MPLAANRELMIQLQEKTVSLSQLNRLTDELRHELVFNRVTNANAAKEMKLLSEQISEKNKELDELRGYIARKDEADSMIQKEFNQQLEIKSQELRQLRRIIEKKGTDEQKTSTQDKEKEPTIHEQEVRVVKSPKMDILLQELREANEQLESKEHEIEELRKQLSARKMPLEAKKDTKQLTHKEIQYNQMYRELTSKLKERDAEISWLRQNLASKERKRSATEEALAKKLSGTEAELDSQRQQIIDNEASNKRIIEELQDSIAAKERLIEKLKTFVMEKKELQARAVRTLRQQLSEMEEQTEQMKREHTEKEVKSAKLFQQAENTATKLAIKENTIHRLSSRLELAEAQNMALQKQLEQLKARKAPKLDIKAIFETNNKKHEDRIKEIIKQHTEREIANSAEIERLNSKITEQKELIAQKQEKIDNAISEFAINAERLLGMREGEKIDTGMTKKEAERLKNKENTLNEREKRAQELLENIKQKVEDTKKREEEITNREEAIATKEALLLKEQEALEKEFEILEKAGFELKQSRDYLLSKKEEIEQAEITTEQRKRMPAAEKPASPVELKTLLNIRDIKPPEKLAERQKPTQIIQPELPIFSKEEIPETEPARKIPLTAKTVKPEPTNIPKKEAEQPRPARILQTEKQKHVEAAQQMFSGQREGYSEVDEIVSLAEIALAHGDKKEQIIASLQTSGYKKEDINKAMAQIK